MVTVKNKTGIDSLLWIVINWILSKARKVFQAVLFCCLLVVLTSCGEDTCYFDLVINEGGDSYRDITKNIAITAKEEGSGPVATIYSKGEAKMSVSGVVSLCTEKDVGAGVGGKVFSACWGGNNPGGDTKTLCPPTVTQENFRETFMTCEKILGRTPLCREVGFCDSNGIGYKVVYVIERRRHEMQEGYGDCGEMQGYQELGCDKDHNETFIFKNAAGNIRTAPQKTGRPCRIHTMSIAANKKQWTEIGNNILPGDILNFTIDKPSAAAPNFLSEKSNHQYQNPDDTKINRWVQDRNKYAKIIAGQGVLSEHNCPSILTLDTDLRRGNCPQIRNGPTAVINDNEAVSSYWSQSGKGLVLYGVESGDCPEDTQCSSYSSFSSEVNKDPHEKFGVLQKLNDEGAKDQKNQIVIRTFIPKQKFSKICSKICDSRGGSGYTDNLGGYTINTNRMSCVATNGNPSPCCDDGRGTLEYKFGVNGVWTAVSTEKKYVGNVDDPGSESFNISNTGERAAELYLRIKSPQRTNISGYYTIELSYKEYVGGGIGKIIESIRDIIKHMFFGDPKNPGDKGLLAQFFNNLSDNVNYVQYIRVLLLLYIVLYGLAFLLGYVEISQKDLIIRILKIGVVLTLISEEGYSFLYDNFFKLFIDGPETLICRSSFVSSCVTGKPIFSFVDSSLTLLFFNAPTWLKLLALTVTSPLGIVLVGLLFVGIFYFIIGVMTAIVSYLMCLMAVAVLILVSPIFIPFILFEKTASLFDNWLNLLARYALEPVLLIIGLQVLVSIYYAVFKELLNFTVCWKCVWPIDLAAISSVGSWVSSAFKTTTTVFCLPFFGQYGVYGSVGIVFSRLGTLLPNTILLIIIAYLIKDYHSFVSKLLDQLGAMKGSSGEGSFFQGEGGKVAAIEQWVGKKLGISSQGRPNERGLDETAKRKGLRRFGIDLDATKLKNTLNNLPEKDLGGPEGEKAASELGQAMFGRLSKDSDAYRGFIDGMQALKTMDQKALNKLIAGRPALKGLQDLHKVLNSQAVKNSLGDLGSNNGEIQAAAMRRVGRAMFMNEGVANSLLDSSTNSTLSKEIFKLGRSSRSKIG